MLLKKKTGALKSMNGEEKINTYLVVWNIPIDASSPEEAANIARSIQLDAESLATVFSIYSDGERWVYDVAEKQFLGGTHE